MGVNILLYYYVISLIDVILIGKVIKIDQNEFLDYNFMKSIIRLLDVINIYKYIAEIKERR